MMKVMMMKEMARLGDTIDTTEQQLERSIESAGLPRMVSRPVRGLKYLLIVALFRGLSEGIRMGLAGQISWIQ